MTVAQLGQVQLLPIGDVKPYPANARRITQRAVDLTAESIRLFGWQQPLVTDQKLVLIVGHVRHRAAHQLGELVVPVVVAEHLTPAQIRAYRVADNRTHDYTAWDYGLLAQELDGIGEDFAKVLDLADWQAIVAGFASSAADGELAGTDPRTAALLGAGFSLTVTFASQEDAEKAAPAILQVPGVINVRHGR